MARYVYKDGRLRIRVGNFPGLTRFSVIGTLAFIMFMMAFNGYYVNGAPWIHPQATIVTAIVLFALGVVSWSGIGGGAVFDGKTGMLYKRFWGCRFEIPFGDIEAIRLGRRFGRYAYFVEFRKRAFRAAFEISGTAFRRDSLRWFEREVKPIIAGMLDNAKAVGIPAIPDDSRDPDAVPKWSFWHSVDDVYSLNRYRMGCATLLFLGATAVWCLVVLRTWGTPDFSWNDLREALLGAVIAVFCFCSHEVKLAMNRKTSVINRYRALGLWVSRYEFSQVAGFEYSSGLYLRLRLGDTRTRKIALTRSCDRQTILAVLLETAKILGIDPWENLVIDAAGMKAVEGVHERAA